MNAVIIFLSSVTPFQWFNTICIVTTLALFISGLYTVYQMWGTLDEINKIFDDRSKRLNKSQNEKKWTYNDLHEGWDFRGCTKQQWELIVLCAGTFSNLPMRTLDSWNNGEMPGILKMGYFWNWKIINMKKWVYSTIRDLFNAKTPFVLKGEYYEGKWYLSFITKERKSCSYHPEPTAQRVNNFLKDKLTKKWIRSNRGLIGI